MPQDDDRANTPTRKWEIEELMSSRLLTDMTFNYMVSQESPLTRESYLMISFGINEDEITAELTAGMDIPWDFQDPEARVSWEETDEPTIRDLEEYGLI